MEECQIELRFFICNVQLLLLSGTLHFDFSPWNFRWKKSAKKFSLARYSINRRANNFFKEIITIEELSVTTYSNYHMEQQQNDNRLAYELASALNDKEALGMYIMFVQKYQEDFLKRILLRVMSIPDNKIKRTRGALFTYLVKEHGSNHFRN